jgi:hypothetical protein
MICQSCRDKNHDKCPELARQADEMLGELEKIASEWCYCVHRDSR